MLAGQTASRNMDDSTAKMYIGNWSDYEIMMQEKFGKDLTP
jgi:hypothetical protein